MNKVLSERSLRVIIIIVAASCIYGLFSGIRMFWIEPEVLPAGRHTRNLITASDYINVVMIVKGAELPGAIAAVNSIIRNTKVPVHFSFVTDNTTVNHLWFWIEHTSLKSLSYEIKAVTREWLEKKSGVTGNINELLPYSIVFVGDLFPRLKGNVIVLEDDVIVQGDLAELKKLQFSSSSIAAFASECDSSIERFKFPQGLYGNFVDVSNPNLRDLHLNADDCTFAPGIFVFGSKKWNSNNVSKQILHWIHLNQKKKLYKSDEPLSAMMLALHMKVLTLNPLWNVRNLGISPGSRYTAEFLREAKLLHWNGPFKPWKRKSPYRSLWEEYFIADPVGETATARTNESRR